MSHVSDSPMPAATQPNVQDVFLNQARRERLPVTVHLMGGHRLEARIKSFDRFAVLVEVDGAEQLIFKHAIAVIAVSGHAGTGQAVSPTAVGARVAALRP